MNCLSLIEKTLDKQLRQFIASDHPLLYEAGAYSLLNPGKRLRPLLALLTVESLGGDLEIALWPSCALEILHTYSLIHDDLPCMDDDDLRRGKPTLHKIYPEGQAVLVGDMLLTLAFEVLAHSPHLPPEMIVRLIQILSSKSGGRGMILGQSLDLLAEELTLNTEQLLEIYHKKTADLISCSLEFGAILSSAPLVVCNTLQEIGKLIGLAFQIVDDILDLEADPQLLGKPIQSDLHNKKSTSITVFGMEKARKLPQELLERSLDLCHKIGMDNTPLAQIFPKLVYRNF